MQNRIFIQQKERKMHKETVGTNVVEQKRKTTSNSLQKKRLHNSSNITPNNNSTRTP
jgi:hypothetical protein